MNYHVQHKSETREYARLFHKRSVTTDQLMSRFCISFYKKKTAHFCDLYELPRASDNTSLRHVNMLDCFTIIAWWQ